MKLSKRWLMVSSAGYGVLFSLALSGAARILSYFLGSPMSEDTAGSIFLVSSLLTAPVTAYFNVAGRLLQSETFNQPTGS